MGGIQNIKMVASTQNNNAQVDVRTLPVIRGRSPIVSRAIHRANKDFAGFGLEIVLQIENLINNSSLDYIEHFHHESTFGQFEWRCEYLYYKDLEESDEYLGDFEGWFARQISDYRFCDEEKFADLVNEISEASVENTPYFYKNPIIAPDFSEEFEQRWVSEMRSWGFAGLNRDLDQEYD